MTDLIEQNLNGHWSIDGKSAADIIIENKAKEKELPKRSEVNAIVGAARIISIGDRREAERYRKQRSNLIPDLWRLYDEVGETGFAIDWAANVISKIKLVPVIWPDPELAPKAISRKDNPKAWEPLDRLKRPHGSHAPLLRRWAQNWYTTGDGYLVGMGVGPRESWSFRSIDEISIDTAGKVVLAEDDESGKPRLLRKTERNKVGQITKPGDFCMRAWIPHPRYYQQANSPIKRTLDPSDILLLLGQEIRSAIMSRLINGILKVPNELSFGSSDPTQDQQGENDPFMSKLAEILQTARQQPGSAGYRSPIVIRGDSDPLGAVEFTPFEGGLDSMIPDLINLMMKRNAQALPLPPEIIFGSSDLSRWVNFAVSQDAWTQHLEPFAIAIVDTVTTEYYWRYLNITSVDENTPRIWFDPTNAIISPDTTKQYEEAYKVKAVSAKAYRRSKGIPETDAPSNEEIILRLVEDKSAIDPVMAQAILQELLGIKLPNRESLTVGRGAGKVPQADPSQVPERFPKEVSAPPGSRSHSVPTGKAFPFTERMIGAADSACRRALERAGSRARTNLQGKKDPASKALLAQIGPTPNSFVVAVLGAVNITKLGLREDDLFDGRFTELKDQFTRWAKDNDFPSESILNAWSVLSSGLQQECRRALYDTPEDFAPIVEPIVVQAMETLMIKPVFS